MVINMYSDGCVSVCLSVCPLGERGVRQVPGRMLSQDVLEQVSVAAEHDGRHCGRTRLLETALLHLRAGGTQLLRDVHHHDDHHVQPRSGLYSTPALQVTTGIVAERWTHTVSTQCCTWPTSEKNEVSNCSSCRDISGAVKF